MTESRWGARAIAILCLATCALTGCPVDHPHVTSCTAASDCSPDGLVCDGASMTCVECLHDADCAGGLRCSGFSCVAHVDGGPGADVGIDLPHDAGPAMPDAHVTSPPFAGQVDLLLMVDNSNSMTEEQASIVTELPRLVQVLVSGDRDGDGTQDFTPTSSLHIGIVDSDMGLGTTMGIATCDPGFGDDGLMQILTRHPGTGCDTSYAATYATTPNVFAFMTGGARTAAQFAQDVGCVATLGTDGCGFEFELESPLKALSLAPTAAGTSPVAWTRPGYHPPTFFENTTGHGDDMATNGAFLRPGSILALVTVNDEDDCSTPSYGLFSIDDPAYTGDLNLRCHMYNDQLFPISRYADGLLGLRADPARLVYAAITGVPPAVAGMSPAIILSDPAMTEQVNPAMPNQLLPACVSPGGRGVAYPAIRMTQLAQQLNAAGASTTIQSICNTDFSGAFDRIVTVLGAAIAASD